MKAAIRLKNGSVPEDEGAIVAVVENAEDLSEVLSMLTIVTQHSYTPRTPVIAYVEPVEKTGNPGELNVTCVIDD